MSVKDKSCKSPEGLQLYLKETPTQLFSCEHSKSFRDSFFIEQLPWLFLNYVLVSEKNFLQKKLVDRLPFDLINLFHVKIQEPTNRSTTTTAFVFLAKFTECYYRKIFKTRSWWRSKRLCGPSITRDVKIYQCHMIKR